MKIKDYFKQAARCFGKAVMLLAQGLFYAAKRLFTRYPNPTWMVIVAALAVASVVKIGQARAERDSYGRTMATLQHQLDSCLQKEVKYEKR